MMSNIRLDKVPCQILYATLATNERGMIFVNFDYLFLQKIPIPILIFAKKFGDEFNINILS